MSIARLRQFARAARLVPRAADLIRRHGRPPAALYFGEAPGDDLMATAVLARWREVRGSRPWYLTRHPGLFEHNPDVDLVLDFEPELAGALSVLGVPRVRLQYHRYDPATDRTIGPRGVHLINLMCASAGLPPLADPAPRFYFREGERPPRARDPLVAVQSSALAARFPNLNKEWLPDRMQQVVHALRADADIVQIGAATDPLMEGATDLRGRTTVRESAGVLARAWAFVGLIGFPMHLARAVGTPSVIVFGGREHPVEDGYPGNRNLFTEMHCSPCWLVNHCPYDRECMRRITADEVIAQARQLLANER
ncbi:MAG TPA: glycosyltransferase family 9 protein [Vicinamibacterales bacterium]|nr:glycosyltransferase family 9 protein [Vicinamibacterales bacterium]